MREYENVFTIKESENIQNYICDIFTKKKMQGFSYECIYTALQKIIMVGDYLSDLEEIFGKEDGDTMPEHMDLEYKGTKIDFHCKPLKQEPKTDVLDKIRAEIEEYKSRQLTLAIDVKDLEKGRQTALEYVLAIIDKYRTESENKI